MSTQVELIELGANGATAIFTTDNGVSEVINSTRSIVDAFEHDITTATGRKRTASLAYKISQLKTRIDDAGKELVADWKSKSKSVDEKRKFIRDELDALRDSARMPLTEWELAEERRVTGIRSGIEDIAAHFDPEADLSTHEKRLSELRAMTIGNEFEEFEAEALRARDTAMACLDAAIVVQRAAAVKAEQEAAQAAEEAARLAAEQRARIAEAARLKAEADAAAKIENERKEKEAAETALANAERARIAAEERAKVEAEIAEKRRLADVEQAKEAERIRIESSLKAEAEAATRRSENERHVRSVNNAAVSDLVANAAISEVQAKAVITAVARGHVRAVSIHY